MAKCSECGGKVYAGGLCCKHYNRLRRKGHFALDHDPDRGCRVPGCKRKHDAHGYCSVHRQRLNRYGDPLYKKTASPGEPQLFIEKALRWKSNRCLIWPYSRDNHGRARIAVAEQPKQVSRIVCIRAHGKPPTKKHEAAHTCGKGHEGCINPRHLTWKTHAENQLDMLVHDSWGNQTRSRKGGASND